MPSCEVGRYKRTHRHRHQGSVSTDETDGVQIFYRTYGHGDIKVLLIMGLAATHTAWSNQIRFLSGTLVSNDEDKEHRVETSTPLNGGEQSLEAADAQQESQLVRRDDDAICEDLGIASSTGIQVCAFDNRGVGRSSTPKSKAEYTTAIMAMDAMAIMDHLGWEKAHVFGHSLGAMISLKMAAMFPDRISSLALLSTTGGGYQCLPKLDWVFLSIAFRFWRAKTPEERALVDLDTHYTKDYLDAVFKEATRRYYLYKEYVRNLAGSGMQSSDGQSGQLNACWKHAVNFEEFKRICTSSFLVSVIHGWGDVIAQIRYARAIAKKLQPVARMVELSGGHLITHQNKHEVNQQLKQLIQAAEMKVHPLDWSKGGQDNDELRSSELQTELEGDSSCCLYVRAIHRWITHTSPSAVFKRMQNVFSKQRNM